MTNLDHHMSRPQRMAVIEAQPLERVGQKPGFFRGTWASYVDIWAHRELLVRLIGRETKARYKDSSLGIVWSLFRPLVQLLIYYFAIGQVLGASRSVPDFAIFVFIGITVWTLYSEILTRSTVSIMDNSGLVKKVYIPREVFPLSAVGSSLVNFGIQCVVLVIGLIFFSHFQWTPYFWLALLGLLMLLVFASALGMLLAALNVYARDIQHFVEIYVAVFFWLSPIVYPFTLVHHALQGNFLETLYLCNPVTIAIMAAQQGLWTAGLTDTSMPQYWPTHMELRVLLFLAVSIVFFWLSQRIFARLQGNFAQEI